MHTMDNNSNVPAFITKLWKLVEDPNYDHLIQWNQNGRSFIIHDQSKFAKELLPLYFKHSNMASFIRQLNMYGFRKVSNIENSGLRSERDDIEFYNQHFVKGREYELEFIKRKVSLKSSQQISTGKPGISPHFKSEDVTDILQDMESMKGKQDSVDNLLSNMQRENEALWREVAILRQKHHKQQQIVEKLIQFLVTLVQNRGLLGIKRKAPLMIDDTEENRQKLRSKMMKRNDNYSQQYSPGNSRSNGPIIHDITDDMTDDVDEIINANSPIITQNVAEMSPNPQVLFPDPTTSANTSTNGHMTDTKPVNILDPLRESIKELGLEPEEVPTREPIDTTTDVDKLLSSSLNTPPGSPSLLKQNSFEATTHPNIHPAKAEEIKNKITDLVLSKQNDQYQMSQNSLNNHVDGIEAELDWLQDQLSSGINIDASTLLGVRSDAGLGLTENIWLNKLFSMEEQNNQIPSSYPMSSGTRNNDITGNEVIQFHPNPNALFDDLDLDQITNDESRDPLLEEQLIPNLDVVSAGSVSFPPETGTPNGQSCH